MRCICRVEGKTVRIDSTEHVMQPLKLTLRAFTGIRDGLGLDELSIDIESLAAGAQLIALVGPNGSGKTTIIDNAHPLC
jgi:exonuclease SbcC